MDPGANFCFFVRYVSRVATPMNLSPPPIAVGRAELSFAHLYSGQVVFKLALGSVHRKAPVALNYCRLSFLKERINHGRWSRAELN
jgi:hypothetical protein